MSRGRQRHQASRRRLYSPRQRDLRERRLRAARDDQYWPTNRAAALEIERGLDGEAPISFRVRLASRASAA